MSGLSVLSLLSDLSVLSVPCVLVALSVLIKSGATKSDEFSENFQRGGGSLSIQKFILQIFWSFKQGFLSIKCKLRVQGMFFFFNCIENNQNKTYFEEGTSYYLALILPCIYATISIIKNCNITFRKLGGGVEGRMEFFEKFIRFVSATLP